MDRLRISALKRSFEVEEVDQPPNPSVPTRRIPTPLLRSSPSPGHKYQDLVGKPSDLPSKQAETSNTKSPKSSVKRIEIAGTKLPEAVSRRTEISIDLSSKQVETASHVAPKISLKRAELLGHKPPEVIPRRTDISGPKLQEPTLRRLETVGSKLPESIARRTETPTPSLTEISPKRVEIQIPKHQEPPTKQLENSVSPHINYHPPQEAQPDKAVTEVRVKSESSAETLPSKPSNMSEPPRTLSERSRDVSLKPSVQPEKTESEQFGYVGIDSILEQMRRKAMKQGFEFNIMVVGQSGLGKATLINTLFKSKVSRKSIAGTEEQIPLMVEMKSISHEIEEKGVRMKLTVIDTPGFGDQVNNENCWQPIMKFINNQYETYLKEELTVNRKKRIPDTRVHCCIYFIAPTGHSLRPLDIEFMRRLSKVVNIVPVIAKADTLTLEERDFFKQKIREDLQKHDINVYPQRQFDEDKEDQIMNDKIREMVPFAVVGSNLEYQVNGRRILGRKTKWGTVEVENITHCEFAYLRDLLIRTHMQNLKDVTSNIHYEAYRVQRLSEGNGLSEGETVKDLNSNV
ncbi:neuronal-specific septin-3 isoform X3 [Callorhinchus milii]|uniref:Septin 9a n=1 Tax=Callorhinchus milii TaxID=7868 RepID=V9KL42_CALMI|nr:neuronal-specific septin-3 isoform X3 [Callorhinchus milii]|eukprot:gi/632942929/ref/XP_007886692.1/ PREDICTED: septin-9 isoform X3 [Callorhinchus milii]